MVPAHFFVRCLRFLLGKGNTIRIRAASYVAISQAGTHFSAMARPIDAVGELGGLGVRTHCCLFEARHARDLVRTPDDLACRHRSSECPTCAWHTQ